MSQDDDDLGGGTLVMAPEDRPDAHKREGAGPARQRAAPSSPSPTNRTSNIDESWDDDPSDAPGTFIMNVDQHASPANPASPFAEVSKQSGAWPQAPAAEHVVIGSRDAAEPGLAVATTLMGMTTLSSDVAAALAERTAHVAPPAFPPHDNGPPAFGLAPHPPAYEPPAPPGQLPSYPQVDPGPAFPRPGSYPSGDGVPSGTPRSGAASLLLGALVGLTTVTVVVGGFYAYRAFKAPRDDSPKATSAVPAASAGERSSPAPREVPGASTASSEPTQTPSALPTATPATGAEAEAKAALQKFGEGLKRCVAETIHVLPGTSPAVPSSMAWLKNGSYQPGIRDFDSSVFACSRFKLTAPMSFVFQWQSESVAGKQGSAIVWLDDDRDGKADRAFAFEAKLEKRDVAEIGPIEATDPARKIKKR